MNPLPIYPQLTPLCKATRVRNGLQKAGTMENVARIRVWVAMPTGGKEALEVLAGERVERLRDKVTSPTLPAATSKENSIWQRDDNARSVLQVGEMKSLAEASGAWSISGWRSPKLSALGKPLVDGESLLSSGVVHGTVTSEPCCVPLEFLLRAMQATTR